MLTKNKKMSCVTKFIMYLHTMLYVTCNSQCFKIPKIKIN